MTSIRVHILVHNSHHSRHAHAQPFTDMAAPRLDGNTAGACLRLTANDHDLQTVGEIVERLIGTVGKGNEATAAKKILVERSTLNRLRLRRRRVIKSKRKHLRIRYVTALRLHRAAITHLGSEWGHRFLCAMGADIARMRGYREWETDVCSDGSAG